MKTDEGGHHFAAEYPEYSKRVNPIQLKYINNLAAVSETAETLLDSLQKGRREGGGGADQFFQTSSVNFLAACIFFFCNWNKMPYDKDGKPLVPVYDTDRQTGQKRLTGKVLDGDGLPTEQTKTGQGGLIDIQKSEEFQTSKFFCKTDFDMKEISEEEKHYTDLPKFYTFGAKEQKERILYESFVKVNREVDEMCKAISQFAKK